MNTQFEIRQKVILDKIAGEEVYVRDMQFDSAEGEAAERVGALKHKVIEAIDERIEALFEALNLADEQVEAAFAYIAAKREALIERRRNAAEGRKLRFWRRYHNRKKNEAHRASLNAAA